MMRQEQIERKMLGYESDERALSKNKSSKIMKGMMTGGRNSMALMPITENEYNLRAKQELEMIKKFKKDKESEDQMRHH